MLAGERSQEQERLSRYTLPPITHVPDENTKGDGDVLRGESASPGLAEGKARIVESVTDIQDLQPGEILCLKGERRVGWTIFFPIIAGLVYEKGNWLCHESNLCRELGIPAVVALGEGINVIRCAERLQIDGREGTVARLDMRVEHSGA